jgi:small-conductance mechanosensitive channel
MDKNVYNSTTSKIRKILLTIVIMTIFWVIAYFVKDIMIHGIKERDRTNVQKENITKKKTENVNLMYEQFATILYYFIIFVGICIVLPMYGIESSTMFAIVGTVGLALSLSTQNLLNNFWAGVVILFNDIYKIDDNVTFSYSNSKDVIRGKVKEFNLFYTKITNKNGEEISLANSVLYGGSGVLTNESIVYDVS